MPSSNARRYPWRRAFLFTLTALVVKAAVLYALRDHPLLQPRGELDTAVYVSLARHSTTQAFFVSPLYLFFLRAVDVSLLLARVVQVILGSLAVLLIFDTAYWWFGDRAATVAAALSILTGVISFYEVTILPASLDPFLVALTLSLLTHALKTDDAAMFAMTGGALGLFVLNRPNSLLWLPVLVIGIWMLRGWRTAVLVLTAFVVPIAPVTIRNYVVAHEVVAIASHGGLNFYIGNNAEADGTYHHVAGIRPIIAGQEEDAPRVAAAALGRPTVTAGETSDFFYGQAWSWIRSHPQDALKLFARKIAYTFNQTDLTLNYSYSFFRQDVASPLRFLLVGPWLLFPLGLVGAARNLRDRKFAVWATFIPVYALSVALFFVSSRYRLPLLIPMCVTAGGMFVRPRVWHWLMAVVIAAGVCFDFGLDDGRAHERTNMIVYLIEQRRFDDAGTLVNSTEAMTRDPATFYVRSGNAYLEAGEPDRALDLVLHVNPDLPLQQALPIAALARSLGAKYVQSEKPDKAMTAFQTAHRFDPGDASDLLNIAVLEAQRGEITAARENARAALRLRPGYPQADGLLRALEGR